MCRVLARLLLLLLLPMPASADDKPAVTVLSFDNHTGDESLEPLGKGLADMMITDLSGLSEVRLVEREKLEALLKELALQRSEYFDPVTAQHIGQVVGAQFALTGAIQALRPTLRIDVRIIRIESGEIVRTAQVTGQRERFFELQKQLAARLGEGLAGALALPAVEARRLRKQPTSERGNHAPTLAAAIDYGHALALIDEGDLTGGAALLEKIAQGAPDFVLARRRLLELLRRQVVVATPSPADRQLLASCRAVADSRLLCPDPRPAPSLAPPPAGAAMPEGGAQPAQRRRGVVAEVLLGSAIASSTAPEIPLGLRAGLFGGYKIDRVIFGLLIEAAYTGASRDLLAGVGLRIAVLRSADTRFELIGLLNVAYHNLLRGPETPGRNEAGVHGFAFDAAPGLRFWAHPQFALGAVAGVRGDFLFAQEPARAISVFAGLQMLGAF